MIVSGQKIRLFGSKFISGSNKSILERKKYDVVMECYIIHFPFHLLAECLGIEK